MKAAPLIRVSGAVAFAQLLDDAGAPVDRLWSRSGISRAILDHPDRLMPLQSLIQFGEEAAADQALPDLGLLAAERAAFESLGAFGRAVRRAPTLFKAIETGVALVSAYDSGERVWMVPEADSIRLCRRVRAPGESFRQADLFTVGLMLNLVRLVAGADWQPNRIELQSPEPLVPGSSDLLSGVEVATGCAATGFPIPRRLLSRVMPELTAPADRSGGPSASLDRPEALSGFLASIREVIATLLASDRATVAAVSRSAGTSVRSLQRSLAGAGASYSSLVDDVRRESALSLLENRDIKVIDIALRLGYSDQAHFTRAFQRWTALSPADYRRGLLDRRDLSA